MYLSLDVTCFVLHLLAYSRRSPETDFFAQPLFDQVLTGWAVACRAYFGMSMVYYNAAFLCVLFHLGAPQDWPPINGSFRENFFSIRKCWGRLWHQFVRRYCTSFGLGLVKIGGFKKGSFASKYTQLWAAFMVSAIMHAPPALHWADHGFWQAVLFLSQPAAIMVEDFVILCGKRMGLRDNGEFIALHIELLV